MLIAACRLAVVQRQYKLWHIRNLIYYFLHKWRLTGRLLLQGHDIFLCARLSVAAAAAAAGKKPIRRQFSSITAGSATLNVIRVSQSRRWDRESDELSVKMESSNNEGIL